MVLVVNLNKKNVKKKWQYCDHELNNVNNNVNNHNEINNNNQVGCHNPPGAMMLWPGIRQNIVKVATSIQHTTFPRRPHSSDVKGIPSIWYERDFADENKERREAVANV